MSRQKSHSPLKKLTIILVVLVLIGGILIYSAFQLKDQLNRVRTMKHNVENIVACAMGQNPDGAQYSLMELKQTTAEVRESLNAPFWKVAAHLPMLGREFRSIQELLNILDSVSDDLIDPAIATLRDNPFTGMDTMDPGSVQAYLEYIRTALPRVGELVSTANSLDLGLLDFGGKVSGLLGSANQLIGAATQNSGQMLADAAKLMQEYPLSSLKVGDGFNARAISAYVDFLMENMPTVRAAMDEIRTGPIGQMIGSDKLNKYMDLADAALQLYDENQDLVAVARKALGNGEDKCYVIMAMNSTEIRALGGFPGSVGVVRIKDGVLTIGDFTSVYNVFPVGSSNEANITQAEVSLFSSNVGAIYYSWDACLCPDFERVSQIWAASFASRHGYAVDGIVALTPTVIQKLLKITGTGIALSDGSWLDGTNATRALEYEMYYRYFGRDNYTSQSNAITDALFAETAKQTLDAVLHSLNKDTLRAYLEMAEECFEERTAMIWMRDPESQQTILNRGWDGGLNKDPMAPEAGIYFNCTIASKMGWFVEIDPVIGEPIVNADNSRTYPMTVTVTNIITQEEIDTASYVYILGGGLGTLDCSMYFFAPAGGSVSDFNVNVDNAIQLRTFRDLQVGYLNYARVKPNTPLVITYNLTTAPGADAPLTISQTPTLQAYH